LGVIFVFLLLAGAAIAQDERRVASPNGQLEFRIFISPQQDSNLPRLAYEVFQRGQPLIKKSFLGLDVQNQEPLLGENVGLTSSASTKGDRYNSLVVKYMQNGSLGRLIDVEIRAYNEGVAFRYIIPVSTPLVELLIAGEATEFRLARENIEVLESKPGAYPPMHQIHPEPNTIEIRLDHPFQGATPLTCPWRIIAIGSDRRFWVN
jgi:hypothetical protein